MTGTTILDGAMGTALRHRGVPVPDHNTSIWSAWPLLNCPGEVQLLHEDYIKAGADVITVNDYALTNDSLSKNNLEHQQEKLIKLAVDLSITARSKQHSSVRIAGTLPPLRTSFKPELTPKMDTLIAEYRYMADFMVSSVDIFLCETMASIKEARAAALAAAETGKPVWVSFTLEDQRGNLRSGETIKDALNGLRQYPIQAFLVNCSSVAAVKQAMPILQEHSKAQIGAYPNPFLVEPADGIYSQDLPSFLPPEAFAKEARNWRELGGTIFGGCCGTNENYVFELRRQFARARRDEA